MTHRDFDAEDAARLEKHGLPTFTLSGVTFTLRDDVPLDVLVLWDEFNQKPEEGAPERSQAARVKMINDVWHNLLVPEDGPAYDALMASPEKPGVIHLVRAAEWAVETITSRPFDQSSDSETSPSEATAPGGSTAPRSLAAVEGYAATVSGTPPT
jgi:hypothetical protein